MKRMLLILTIFVLLIAVIPTMGQGAPESINAAIADLSGRVGVSLTINDLENWFWSQGGYEAACAGGTPPGGVVGYQFLLSYGGQEYDYRVTADSSVVVLCSTTPIEEDTPATPTPIDPDDMPYTNPLCPIPDGTISYSQTRLMREIQARVAPGLPNNVRAQPDTDAALVGEIPAEAIFTLLEGPTCDDEGRLWWQVDYDGLIGWTAEYSNGEYLLEPVPGAPLSPVRSVITNDNAVLISEASRLEGNHGSRLAFLPASEEGVMSTQFAVLGGLGNEGLWIYDLNDLSVIPRSIFGENLLTEIAFADEPNIAVLGDADGSIRFWDISPAASLVERAFLQGHDSPISALDYNGVRLVTSGGVAFIREIEEASNEYAMVLWDVENVAPILALRGHDDEVMAVRLLVADIIVSAGLDGTARFWDTTSRAQILRTELGSPALDLLPYDDQTSLALALASGEIALLATESGELLTSFFAHSGVVNTLALSPDGAYLASGGTDGIINIWDINMLNEEVQPLTSLTGHDGAILDVVWSPDGRALLSLGEDNAVRVWTVVESVG